MTRLRSPATIAARAVAALSTLAFAASAWAAGGPPATKLLNVADTRKLEPGIGLWIAEIYNDSFVLFGALVVAVMVLQGVVLGFGMDKLMGLLGLDLGKLSHHE